MPIIFDRVWSEGCVRYCVHRQGFDDVVEWLIENDATFDCREGLHYNYLFISHEDEKLFRLTWEGRMTLF